MLRPDRLVDGDELGAVGEGGLDLHIVDHLGDAVHHLIAGDHVGTGLHQVGDAAPVARALDDEIGDQCDRFGMVELDTAAEAVACDDGCHRDQEFVLFAGRQVHREVLEGPETGDTPRR